MADLLPYLPEHQAPSAMQASPQDYNPTPDQKKLLKRLEAMYQKAKQQRKNYDKKWMDYYKMFRGKQWREERPSYRNSPVFNLIFQIIQSQVPIITDARPKFEFVPEEPSDQDFADIMNEIAAYDWESGNFQYTLSEAIYDSHFYGTSVSELTYSEENDQIKYKTKDVFYFFPDPDAENIEHKCDYTVFAEPISTYKLKAKYPDFAQYLKPDILDTLDPARNDLGPIRSRSPLNDRLIVEGSGIKLNEDNNKTLVMTFYYEDDETEQISIQGTDSEGSDTQTTQTKLKYPGLRKTVVAHGVILSDGPCEYDDQDFPYQILVNYILPREFWGMGEIEQLEGPQRSFNMVAGFVFDVLTLMGNPIWIVDSSAMINTQNLTNAPGLIVEKTPGSEVRREAGVQLQPYVIQILQIVKEWTDQIAGSQDVTRGIPSPGVTAAAAISDLQNAAQTRLRLKSRILDSYLERVGRQYASRVMQFYTAPKVFRLTGKDGANEYFRAFFKENDLGQKVLQLQRFNPDTYGLSDQVDEYTLRGKLDIRVATGSSLPFSKNERRAELESLYDRGIIDAEEFLKGIDYPNYQAVLDRMKAAAEARAQQAPAQPPKPA